jgi:hypothetical protein
MSFLCCLVELRFVQLLFCDDHHRTRCTLQVHEKVHQLSWVSFASNVKLLVLESWSQTLISALIVVLSSASGICDLCCMNLFTKFRNGSLSFCLQLYKSDDSAVVS